MERSTNRLSALQSRRTLLRACEARRRSPEEIYGQKKSSKCKDPSILRASLLVELSNWFLQAGAGRRRVSLLLFVARNLPYKLFSRQDVLACYGLEESRQLIDRRRSRTQGYTLEPGPPTTLFTPAKLARLNSSCARALRCGKNFSTTTILPSAS